MNLVNELQVSAERDDVQTVLRKAKRLASKLGLRDISDWLRHEQEGYPDRVPVPQYRVVKAHLAMNSNGPIPAGYGMMMRGTMDYPGGFTVDRQMPDAMSQIVSMIQTVEGNKCCVAVVLDERDVGEFRRTLHPLIADQVTFILKINSGQLRAIPDAVKNRVLDWACELEEKGILGENMSFNEREKQLAHTVHFHIVNSQVGQLTNSGNNHGG